MESVLSKQNPCTLFENMKKTICLNPIIKKTSVIEAVEAGEWMRKTFMLDFVYHR